METSLCCNSVVSHQIATNFCTCHDSTAVVPCTKFCSDHCIRIEMRVKRNFHRIWIAMEKPLMKRGPGVKNTTVNKRKLSMAVIAGNNFLLPICASSHNTWCQATYTISFQSYNNEWHCVRFSEIKVSFILYLQYIPRNMHTVFALLCFVVVIHWLIFPYPTGLLHWHCGNLTIVPVPAKQPWWIWIILHVNSLWTIA